MDATAGRTLPEQTPEPVASTPATAPGPKATTVRQTLDLPRDTYKRLQGDARYYADELGFAARELSAQHLLRAMLEYVQADEQRMTAVVQIARRHADERRSSRQ